MWASQKKESTMIKKTLFAVSLSLCTLMAADTNTTATTTDANTTAVAVTTSTTTTSTTTTATTTTVDANKTDVNATVTGSIGMPPAPPSADITAVNNKGVTHITQLKKGRWNLVSLMGYKPIKATSLFPVESADFIKAVYAYDNDSNNYLGAKPGVAENDVFAKMGLNPLKNISPDMGLWIYATDNARIEYKINLTNPDDTTIRLVGPNATIVPSLPKTATLFATGKMDETTLDKEDNGKAKPNDGKTKSSDSEKNKNKDDN
jgi:hypothetical protein